MEKRKYGAAAILILAALVVAALLVLFGIGTPLALLGGFGN